MIHKDQGKKDAALFTIFWHLVAMATNTLM